MQKITDVQEVMYKKMPTIPPLQEKTHNTYTQQTPLVSLLLLALCTVTALQGKAHAHMHAWTAGAMHDSKEQQETCSHISEHSKTHICAHGAQSYATPNCAEPVHLWCKGWYACTTGCALHTAVAAPLYGW